MLGQKSSVSINSTSYKRSDAVVVKAIKFLTLCFH